VVIAPLGSVLIAQIKNTIAAAIGVPEAFYTMWNQLQNHGDTAIPIFAGYALFFVVLTLPVGLLFGWLAKRWSVAGVNEATVLYDARGPRGQRRRRDGADPDGVTAEVRQPEILQPRNCDHPAYIPRDPEHRLPGRSLVTLGGAGASGVIMPCVGPRL
jgi:hypothetical protein